MGHTTSVFAPLALIVVGTGWLLSNIGVAPQINWVWTLSLAGLGVLMLLVSGVDKLSIVFAPLLLVASGLSVLRQSGRLSLDIEAPILVILMGVLLLIARSPRIRAPSWIKEVQVKP